MSFDRSWKPALLPVILIAGLASQGCAKHEEEAAHVPQSAPVRVHTVDARMAEVPGVYEATGVVRAAVTSMVAAQVMAQVVQVHVNAGDIVAPGQTLATLDSREVETAVRQAEASRAEVKDAFPEAQQHVVAAQAQLQLAQATYQRMAKLFEERSLTAQELDEAKARLAAAQSNVEVAQAHQVQLKSKLQRADEGVKQASIIRGHTVIRAPFAGVVIDRKAEPGMIASPGMPLFVIEQGGAYRFEAQVEQRSFGMIKAGQTSEVSVDTTPEPIAGRVVEIVPALDPATHTFTVKIALPGKASLRSGIFGRARFTQSPAQALVIPASAVQRRGQLETVYVANGNRAVARLITTNPSTAGQLTVSSGLSAGERLVNPIPEGLSDGSAIEVQP